MMSRDEMLQMAIEEYERVRGHGSWIREKAILHWNNDAYQYLDEKEIRIRAKMQAAIFNPGEELPMMSKAFSDFYLEE